MLRIIQGDCIEQMRTLPDKSVHCCVTSPPYWGLRDYGVSGQIGLEGTPLEYVAKLGSVFQEVWRVLRDDGTCWINLGDSYSRAPEKGGSGPGNKGNDSNGLDSARRIMLRNGPSGMKPKDLVGIPWRVAFALQEAGWYLRSDIIWHKPNPMPESVTDRPTKAHEYIFLLSKSERYYYDAEAIKEQSVSESDSGNGFAGRQGGADHLPMGGGVGTVEPWKRGNRSWKGSKFHDGKNLITHPNVGKNRSAQDEDAILEDTRNKRSVWTVTTKPFKGAHFATFPPDLILPCILAGCPIGGTVLDPFGGSGTTGQVAIETGRSAILIELNPAYVELAQQRCNVTPGLALS